VRTDARHALRITVMLTIFFAACILFVVALIALDLGVLHRTEHVVGMREALSWTAVWVTLALSFSVAVYFLYGHNWLGFVDRFKPEVDGPTAVKQFLNGYLLELSLSMDNLFVFATILAYFRVPLEKQHRVLVWGILGAIFLRGVMIALGAALVERFDWIMYVFGALLLYTAWKMLKAGNEEIHPDRNIFIRAARKFFPTTTELHGNKFFATINGVRHMTPLFLALILVDIADIMFAIDSIPAIFGVTREVFIVFTSNMFAIMGLRSMYFALIGLMHRFHYLKPAIVLLLAFIGVKMLLHHVVHINDTVSLLVILGVLGGGVLISLLAPAPKAHGKPPDSDDHDRAANARNEDAGSSHETAGSAARIRTSVDVSS
jgi:tellurite resistance protein TerC